MATPTTGGSYTYVADSGTPSIDAFIYGFKWGGGVGTGTTVTFSFPNSTSSWDPDFYDFWGVHDEPFSLGYGALGTAAQQGAISALQAWDNVANINFLKVNDTASVVGDIRIAYTSGGYMDAGTYAYTYTPSSTGHAPGAGDVWLNATPPNDPAGDFSLGARGYKTLIHELGHAIGLDHPFNPFNPEIPDTGLTVEQNTYKYTVMAYCDAPGHWDTGGASFYPTTPMLLDIVALQHLYGANTTYHTGNDTYTYNQGSNYYQTIWDAGGTDTFVYNATAGGVIDLRAGNFSQVGNAIHLSDGTWQYDTVAIAYGVVIENAVGGSGNDTIYGNSAANVINAGAGADTMAGGLGNDNYVVDNAGDTVTENVGEGTDIVRAAISYTLGANVENLTLLGTGNINATGNGLGNVITGNSGNNVIDGGVSADAMAGGLGNDTYVVDNSGDTVTEAASAGTDTVQASASFALGANVENLTLTGGADLYGIGNTLNNAITGNGGNNILNGGTGADTLAGGAGNDNYVVDNAGDTVTENAAEGTDLVRSFVSYSLGNNLENFTLLGTGNINAAGNALDNVITGNAGNNIINGGAGADTMAGGVGNDNYVVDDAGDTVTEAASAGTDIVRAAISYTLGANVENLTLLGTGNINATGNGLGNAVTGNSGDNVIDGGAGADAMAGGLGNDTYVVDNSGDTVTEGAAAGTDTVQASASFALGANVENLTLTGGAHIYGIGNTLNNVITGNGGNNILNGGTGADTMAGGAGNDNYVVDNAGDGVTENAAEGTDLVRSFISYSLGDNLENLTLLGTGNINAAGNALDNVITGNAGNNVINAGAGADTMAGGAGNDNYVVDDAGDTVTEAASAGTDIVRAAISYTLGANVENLTLLGTANINATGNDLNNAVTGNSGNNVLDGGAGADAMAGGLGDDTYVVDNAGDTVAEGAAAGTDTVQSSVTYALGDNLENLTLTGAAHINGIGNALDNVITGNGGNNIINAGIGADTMAGGAGNDNYVVDNAGDTVTENVGEGTDIVRSLISYTLTDNVENLTLLGTGNINATGNGLNNAITGTSGDNVIDGGAGADAMSGGLGNDTYVVDNSGDTVTEAASAGTDTVQASITHVLGANVENLTLTGGASINGVGNALDNTITGNGAANVLNGAAGNDALMGGAGNDLFRFTYALNGTTNVDSVLDFTLGEDVLQLSHFIFSNLGTGALGAGELCCGDFTTGQDTSHLVFNTTTGNLYYDADASGAGESVLFAQLTAGLGLTENDFWVI